MLRSKVELTGTVTGGGISVMHWAGTASDTTVHTAIGTALNTFWTALKPLMSAGVTATLLGEIDEVTPETGKVTASASMTPWSIVGTGSGEVLPPSNQGLIRWRTGDFVDGREVRGRLFIPGPTEALSSNGIPHSTYTSPAQAAAAALIADSATSLHVWQRPRPARAAVPGGRPAQDARAGSSHAVVSASVWTQFAVLRSRRD